MALWQIPATGPEEASETHGDCDLQSGRKVWGWWVDIRVETSLLVIFVARRVGLAALSITRADHSANQGERNASELFVDARQVKRPVCLEAELVVALMSQVPQHRCATIALRVPARQHTQQIPTLRATTTVGYNSCTVWQTRTVAHQRHQNIGSKG